MALVCVQMGHVARTSGSTGTNGEQEFARKAAAHLAGRLGWYGHRAVVIKADDRVPRSDVFVAIHADGSISPSAGGASVGYQDGNGQALGTAWKRAYQALGWRRGFRPDNYTPALRGYYGVSRARRAGTRYAIICEAGFLTNPTERGILLSQGGQERFAQAVVNAIGAVVGHPKQPSPDRSDTVADRVIYAEGRDVTTAQAALGAFRPAGVVFAPNLDTAKQYVAEGKAVVVAFGGPAAQALFPDLHSRGSGYHTSGKRVAAVGVDGGATYDYGPKAIGAR